MSLLTRFQRLSVWNKLGVLGALASFLGLIVAAYQEKADTRLLSPANESPTSSGNQSPAISAGRDVHVTYGEARGASLDPLKAHTLSPDVLSLLMPNMRERGVSPRYLDSILGIPILESESTRTYIVAGHRIYKSWGEAGRASQSVIGPAEGSSANDLSVLSLAGPWGRIGGKFGKLTIGDILDESWDCSISDWNYGARGRCFNLFEIECGGSQAQDELYYRFGVDSCSFSTTVLNAEARALLDRPLLADTEASDKVHLAQPEIRAATVNFFMVTDQSRQCPRGAGCD